MGETGKENTAGPGVRDRVRHTTSRTPLWRQTSGKCSWGIVKLEMLVMFQEIMIPIWVLAIVL